MDKVRTLKKVNKLPPEGLIEALKSTLELAKQGKLRSFILVGDTDCGNIYRVHNTTEANYLLLIGAMEFEKQELYGSIENV